MKRFFYYVLVIAIVISMTACATPSTTPEETTVAPTASEEVAAPAVSEEMISEVVEAESVFPSDLPAMKIAVVYSTFADKLGSQFKSSLESLAEPFNVEFMFVETGFSTEQGQAAVDSAMQSGIDGLMMVSTTVATADNAQKAGVALVGYSGQNTEEIALEISAYDNYIGTVADSNYNIGLHSALALYEAGCRKIGVIGLTPGLAKSHDDRMRGFVDGAAQYPEMEIIAEDLSMAQWAPAVSSFAAAYPEMDGIFSTASNEAVYQAIANEGLIGSVKLATVDISESTKDYFDNGTLVYIAGGQYGTIMTSFAVLYNYLYDGTMLLPDTAKPALREHIEIRNSVDYELYEKFIEGDLPVYTPEEIAAMIVGFNPDFTYENFEELCANFSLVDVAERHSDLVD